MPTAADIPHASSGVSAREALEKIFQAFVAERSKNMTVAYQKLRDDLATNAHILTPDVISLGDFLSKLISLEEFLKGLKSTGGGETKPPIEVIADFLNSDPHAPKPIRTIDNDDKMIQ
jgi:hypothetical protein